MSSRFPLIPFQTTNMSTERPNIWKMESNTPDNGKMENVTDWGFRFGLITVNTKGIGIWIKLVAWGDSYTLMETFMKENDSMTKHMDLDSTSTRMEQNI